MNEQENLIMEQEIEKGHIAKAALIFLASLINEQREKIIPMLQEHNDEKTDIFIADLSALNRVKKILARCVEMSETAEKKLIG